MRYSGVIDKDSAVAVVVITSNKGTDAKIKYIGLQFSKYCCSDDLVELKSKPTSCELKASAIVGSTFKRKSGKFQVTLSDTEKSQSHVKI
jgi:hypothetical protein